MPEVIDNFFVQAAPISGIHPKETRQHQKVYRIGRVPRTLWPIGERLETRFGKLGHEYKKITFDKHELTDDPTLEWVTPGHRRDQTEQALIEQELNRFLTKIRTQRQQEVKTISDRMEISFSTIFDKVQCQFAELISRQESGAKESGLDGRIKQMDDRLFELNGRLETRREDLEKERSCTIADIQHHGRAWVLPHPERTSPEMAAMVSDRKIERIAVEAVIAYEEARRWLVVSVEKENRGFDLISRKPHPEDPSTAIAVRFIEVKGRSRVGEVAITTNEYKTAERLKKDYWLYVVFNCTSTLEVRPIQYPVQLGWESLVKIEHYHVDAEKILEATK
ncbi:DUF3883 domain-containing protein [Microcoleus sp. herbarium2]|uniref:DUF3883 domain-containing protein n=1 Tax=Microcoleus sp. herbarium2 TaxID=3055433 RepID=UPI002FCEF45E